MCLRLIAETDARSASDSLRIKNHRMQQHKENQAIVTSAEANRSVAQRGSYLNKLPLLCLATQTHFFVVEAFMLSTRYRHVGLWLGVSVVQTYQRRADNGLVSNLKIYCMSVPVVYCVYERKVGNSLISVVCQFESLTAFRNAMEPISKEQFALRRHMQSSSI